MKRTWQGWMGGWFGLAMLVCSSTLANAQPPDERQPRDERRSVVRDDERRVDTQSQDAPAASPSDLPLPEAAPPAPLPQQHFQQGQSGACCCPSGTYYTSYTASRYNSVTLPQPSGYVYNGGYAARSYAAPPYRLSQSGRRYGETRVFNGANWNRFDEHDSRNFSGSYGSRASLRLR